MKLERELAFCHSKKMGVEPGSKSFDLNEGDQNSAGYKLQNKKVKNGSMILRKNEWGLDQSDCKAVPKLEFYNSTIDFNGDHVATVVDFVAPNSHSSKDKRGLDPSQNELQSAGRKAIPTLEFYDSMLDLKSHFEAHANAMKLAEPVSSKDMESFLKLPNDKQSVKKSAISPIGTFQNSADVHTDNTATEYEPGLGVYYQGNTYHLVKEICVGRGVLVKPRLMFEDSVDDNAYNCIPSLIFGNKEILKNNAGNEGFNLPATEESVLVSANHDRGNNVIQEAEDLCENHIGNACEEVELPEDTHDSIPSGDKDEEFSDEPEYVSKFLFLKKNVEEGVSAEPALGLAVEESNSDGTTSLSYHFEHSALADCGKKDSHQLPVSNCNVTPHTFRPLEGHFVQGESSQIRNSLGEASFSAAGPVSGRISYSGSIPNSGSISIRSDSSTTSTRSFAFPILQSEYVSSPARMAEPEQNCDIKKQSTWKNLLLCCKF